MVSRGAHKQISPIAHKRVTATLHQVNSRPNNVYISQAHSPAGLFRLLAGKQHHTSTQHAQHRRYICSAAKVSDKHADQLGKLQTKHTLLPSTTITCTAQPRSISPLIQGKGGKSGRGKGSAKRRVGGKTETGIIDFSQGEYIHQRPTSHAHTKRPHSEKSTHASQNTNSRSPRPHCHDRGTARLPSSVYVHSTPRCERGSRGHRQVQLQIQER